MSRVEKKCFRCEMAIMVIMPSQESTLLSTMAIPVLLTNKRAENVTERGAFPRGFHLVTMGGVYSH